MVRVSWRFSSGSLAASTSSQRLKRTSTIGCIRRKPSSMGISSTCGPTGAGVVRVTAQDRLEHAEDLLGPLCRLAVRGPKLPGPQVHRTLGIQGGRVQVVGVLAGQFAHGFLVGGGEPLTVGVRVGGAALGQ